MAKRAATWLVVVTTNKSLSEITSILEAGRLQVDRIQLRDGDVPPKPKTIEHQGTLALDGRGSPETVRRRMAALASRRQYAIDIIKKIIMEQPLINAEELALVLNRDHPGATTRYHTAWTAQNVAPYVTEAMEQLTNPEG